MKRLLVLLLSFVLMISLYSCGKSDAAQAVDEMISSIGIVNENSKDAIEEAEAAWEKLSDSEKKSLENFPQLEEAKATYNELMANQAITAINWIGAVNEYSWNDIQNARQIYDNLTEAEKQLVSNYSELTLAEEQYTEIKVGPIEKQIEELGNFNEFGDTLPDGFADAVDAANKVYEELDEVFKNKVSNYNKLVEATKYLSDYRVNHLIAYIDENLSEVSLSSGINLTVANAAYDMLTDEEKARVSNYDILKNAQEKFDNLAPIQLNSYTLGKNSIGEPTIKISATNISDKAIKEFTVCIFSFDADGIPVKVYFNDFANVLRYSDALKAGETTKSRSYWQLYGDYSEMKQFVAILRSVEFYDGTTWANSQYDSLFSKYNEKILSADAENILLQT